MIVVVDNYDSFTYNLVQYIGEALIGQGIPVSRSSFKVVRNDEMPAEEIGAFQPSHIIISPGPCTPNEAGISMAVIKEFSGKVPILGVCLGHQSIGQVFGGEIIRTMPMHGKTSMIHHDGKTIFSGIVSPFTATRYHSLIIKRESLPDDLEISAYTDDGIIMGVRHRDFTVEGVQFHPESVLTEVGRLILANFLALKVGSRT